MEENKSKVYVLLDERNRIMRCDGGYSISNVDVDTWTYIDEGTGDKYNLCQTHYFEKSVLEEHGIPQYKYENNKCVERTQAEIDEDIANIPPAEPNDHDLLMALLGVTE